MWRYARKAALRRDRYKCVRCGAKAEEVDHIIPRMGMKLSTWSCLHHLKNLRSLCRACHVARRHWDQLGD
ncbi:hypothetical protein UB45_07675 [Terrabacter sp. 28]|nr:hypothetical protein UB45_07675 [Terrabacter sp. 28]